MKNDLIFVFHSDLQNKLQGIFATQEHNLAISLQAPNSWIRRNGVAINLAWD